jgi:ankyrin repeat protein
LLKSLEDDYEFDRVISKSFLGSVLMTAIYDRNLPMVQILLKYGASPNQMYDNILPLTAAANFEDLQICINLLQHGAFLFDIKSQHRNYPNPVSLAIQAGWEKAVIFLLNLGADPDGVVSWMHMVIKTDQLESGSRLLHLAVIKKDIKIIKILLEKRADVFLTDSSDNTPLHTACKDPEMPIDIIQVFIDHIKILKGQNNCSVTDTTSETTSQAIAIHLANFINAKNKNGQTALMLACSKGFMPAINILLQIKANLNTMDIWKKTALNYAIENGFEDTALLLIRSGAEVHNGKGVTLLRSAIGAGQDGITDILLEKGLDVKQVSKQKESALHFAVQAQNLHLVKLFIKKGEIINYSKDNTKNI